MTDKLNDDWRDRVAQVARAGLSAVPIVGGPLGEIVSEIIPGLRQDRIVKYLRELAARIETLEQDKIQAVTNDPERIDLIETGGLLAAKATTDERIQRIVSLVFRGLSMDDANIIRRKRFAALLGEVDDDEIQILNAYGQSYGVSGSDAWDSVNQPYPIHMQSSRQEMETEKLFELGREHLLRLGLIERKFSNTRKGEYPEFDPKTGGFKGRLEISFLGRMFLRELGIELPFKD